MGHHDSSETELRSFIAAIVETAAAATKRNRELEGKLSNAAENIGRLRESIEVIEEEALTDFLTKLANRRRFDKFLREAIATADKEGSQLSIIVCDIDHFKKFNDAFGHQVGDHVTKFVADILKKNTKGQDRAARYGGEAFAIVLPNTGAVERADARRENPRNDRQEEAREQDRQSGSRLDHDVVRRRPVRTGDRDGRAVRRSGRRPIRRQTVWQKQGRGAREPSPTHGLIGDFGPRRRH